MKTFLTTFLASLWALLTPGRRERPPPLENDAPYTDRVVALELFDAASGVKLGDVLNGTVFEIVPLSGSAATGPSLNIRAVVVNSSSIASGNTTSSITRSVQFAYLGSVVHVDNVEPYSFCGNVKGKYNKCDRLGQYGSHTVTATPYSGTKATGAAGRPYAVTFIVKNKSNTGSTDAPATQSSTKAPASPKTPPVKAPTKSPAGTTPMAVPAKPPTKTPLKPPSKSPTARPAKAPTNAPTQPITYVPGKATVRQNGLILSQGLASRLIAQSGQPVRYANGQQSSIPFHSLPDGAAVFRDPASSSYKYVSNSEAESNAGVGALTFDQHGNVTGYERLQSGTMRNCGGGKTYWNTWLTCEEWSGGHVWEINPFATTDVARRTVLASPYQAPWESAAYDVRDASRPTIYVTADKVNGALLRFTPSAAAVATARANNNYAQLLHTASNDHKWEYLVLTKVTETSGTFSWTTNVATAEASAEALYKGSEGIDIRNGLLYFTAKTDKLLFILNLDLLTYTVSSTVSGAFNGQPDQVARLLDDNSEDILYFCEDVDTFSGVHGRDTNGKYYTIVQGEAGAVDGETSGLAFGPNNMLMYVSFQKAGKIFEIRRTDGRPFNGQRLDIKYHDDGTNPNPF